MKTTKLISTAVYLAIGFLLSGSAVQARDVQSLNLAGEWRYELDRQDEGISDKWFDKTFSQTLKLPGCLSEQGIGDEVGLSTKWMGQIVDKSFFTAPEYEKYRTPGNFKIPFWLQPERYFAGAVWYQRTIKIPESWMGKRVVLFLERPHWETQVWIDGNAVGVQNGLSMPHEYDLGCSLQPGVHRLAIRVDNRMVVDVGINSHSVSDHTQGNWNGIVGKIHLYTTDPVWLNDLQVYPQVQRRSAIIRGKIGNATGKAGELPVILSTMPADSRRPTKENRFMVKYDEKGAQFEFEQALSPDMKLWDEFQPALYCLTARLGNADPLRITFGMREISTQGTQFLINGKKTFIRGTLDCCIYPLTGYPPTEVEPWKRIIRIAKAHGLNNIRFHSWCPPEAAFVAADELGFYLQVECASWANTTTQLGKGLPIDQWLYDEADRILKAYGNHPSFLFMPYGNEPAGEDRQYLGKWVNHYKAKDSRRLYTSGSGWPQISENQFHVLPDPRIQAWGGGLKSRINALPPETRTDYRDYIKARNVPVISHEIGQWCVYPNFAEMSKYKGYLKPKNFEIFKETLAANHMLDLAPIFLKASGKLQALCYKEDIESALRTPGMGGFQLLDLHDFPGQGTALVGVLDPFWDEKGYISAEEFDRFCQSTVPLARLSKRVFLSNETLEADLEVAHFGPSPLVQKGTRWKLINTKNKVMVQGTLAARDIPIDNGTALGKIQVNLNALPAPAKYKLVVSLEKTTFENDWDIWIYPSSKPINPPSGIFVTDQWNEKTVQQLNEGGTVFLQIPPNGARGDKHGKVAVGFSSIFWNTAWTQRQAPHTLGILCNPQHPALAQFPTEYHSNWQWWYLVTRSEALILDNLPPKARPIVSLIDDWFTNRRLGLLLEAKVGQGKILISSLNLGLQDNNPVARQMLHSLYTYMDGNKFKPATELTVEQVSGLLNKKQ